MNRKLTDREQREAEASERAMAEAPESALRRREFLTRTAYTAGLAGVAASLPMNVILGEAAKREAIAAGLPRPARMPIDHFVIVMMENRSFDHYFGWFPSADGVQARTYPDPQNGNAPVPTQHASALEAQWQGCGHPDPGHGWSAGRQQLGSSLNNPNVEPDGFLAGSNDEFALSYYNEGELGFIHPAAHEFTLYDRYHCSLMGPTWPNRYYKWSAQSGGKKDNTPPASTLGNQWDTMFDRALANNPGNVPGDGLITARYYNSDLPFSAVWGDRAVPWTSPIDAYYTACTAGTLPNITIVDPPFRDGGGGDGLSADEHPHGDVRLGQAWMSDVAHAFIDSPHWERGALFIIYDEWGGFFDHVRPPRVPDDRGNVANINEDFGLMGYRIPAVVISPYAWRGRVSHLLCGHESIVKLIMYRFGLGDLCMRDRQANNIGNSMRWIAPQLERPNLPDPATVVTQPCSFGGGAAASDTGTREAHANDLAELEELAYRNGFSTGTGNVDQIFRMPDTMRKAIAKGRRKK